MFFEVLGRRDLAQRAAAAAPGVRFSARRSWTRDPGEPRRPFLGGRAPRVGRWHWQGTEDELLAEATAILLRFIHPLVARGLPYCLGFAFAAQAFAPRSLGFGEAARLDLEDIGRLLGAAPAGRGPRRARPLEPRDGRPRAASGPDGERLDAAQRAAAEHGHGPARVLAPAGSGKTKTLISRVAELVDRGADPSAILMLAFNRKAAEQLEERLGALGIASTRRLGSPHECRPRGVHCATFNAFGYRYQREVIGSRVTLDLDGAGLRRLMERAMDAAGVSMAGLQPARGSDPVGAFLGGLTRVRAALEPPETVEIGVESAGDVPVVTTPFAAVHAAYTRVQQTDGRQSFDDQVYLTVADLLADPAHRVFVQHRFEHVLVDEFQDLNAAQLALVDVVSRPRRALFVVGDDDQLIYGWRHADPRGILAFHERMPPRPWSATYSLLTNYRCSRSVVECGARLVANNVVREPKDVRPRDGARDGAVRFAGAPAWPERAAAICRFLRAERSRLGCAWRDLAVLCRYRSQQLAVALALDADGVPRTPTLGYRLFTHPAASLLRAYIDLVRAPDAAAASDIALVLNRPNRYIGNAVVRAVGAASRPWAYLRVSAANEPAAGPRPLSTLVEQVERLAREVRTAEPLTALQLVWAVVDEFELEEFWDAAAPASAVPARAEATSAAAATSTAAAPSQAGGRDGAGPLQILDALLLLAETCLEPSAFLRLWERLRANEAAREGMSDDTLAREVADEDRVVIGTIHAAKGREYRAVVIPDYDCDVTRWEPAEIEEERRVVYVGVTRAIDTALFTVDTSTMWVQPFLRELVEAPGPDEHASLTAWLDGESDADLRRRIADRINEIEVLFPEAAMTAAPDDAMKGGSGPVEPSS